MYKLKKVFRIIAFTLILTMAVPSISSIGTISIAQAATIRLNYTTLKMDVGETKRLEVKGTSKKATWESSNKGIAIVNNKGVVKAIKAGKATITATVSKKKYTCNITVKETNPYIINAPFKAKEINFGKLVSVIPSDWKKNVLTDQGNSSMIMLYPSTADLTKGTSNITVTIVKTDTPQMDYSKVKTYLDGLITQDYIISQFSTAGIEATLSDFVVNDYKATLGTAYKVEYTVNYTGGTSDAGGTVKQYNGGYLKQTLYFLYIDNYIIQLSVTKTDDSVTPDVDTVGEYMLNSFVAND